MTFPRPKLSLTQGLIIWIATCILAASLQTHQASGTSMISSIDVNNTQAIEQACDRITPETRESFYFSNSLLAAVLDHNDPYEFEKLLENILTNQLPSPISMKSKTSYTNLIDVSASPPDPFTFQHRNLKGIFKDYKTPLVDREDAQPLGMCAFVSISLIMHDAGKRKGDNFPDPEWTYMGGNPRLILRFARSQSAWTYRHLLWATKWSEDWAFEWHGETEIPNCNLEVRKQSLPLLSTSDLVMTGHMGYPDDGAAPPRANEAATQHEVTTS